MMVDEICAFSGINPSVPVLRVHASGSSAPKHFLGCFGVQGINQA
jgi:hypothetical protein